MQYLISWIYYSTAFPCSGLILTIFCYRNLMHSKTSIVIIMLMSEVWFEMYSYLMYIWKKLTIVGGVWLVDIDAVMDHTSYQY